MTELGQSWQAAVTCTKNKHKGTGAGRFCQWRINENEVSFFGIFYEWLNEQLWICLAVVHGKCHGNILFGQLVHDVISSGWITLLWLRNTVTLILRYSKFIFLAICILRRTGAINPSMPASVHCTDMYFVKRCRPRCTVLTCPVYVILLFFTII
jgi:hypothetical protein